MVFGTDKGFPAALELSGLDGSNGFALNGIAAHDVSGWHVSGARDVNGDGFDDLIIGALRADPNGLYGAGQSYVVFGTDRGFSAELELSAIDGSNGFALNGIAPYDYSGTVSGAGDVNGDGIDDLLIGARGADPNGESSGQTYVVFGRRAAAISIPEQTEQLIAILTDLPPDAFSNSADQRINAFENKLQDILAQLNTIDETTTSNEKYAIYSVVLDKLRNDVLAKTDGFHGGNPKNDWIVTQAGQDLLYPKVANVIEAIEAEMAKL